MTPEIRERNLRRLLITLVAMFFITVIILTLVELLRFPTGMCQIDGLSAACIRQRVVILLPWVGMGVAIWVLVLRSRTTTDLRQTVIPEDPGGESLGTLHVLYGPAALVGKNIAIYRNQTLIGRDPVLAEVLLYGPRDRSSISGLHCTLRYDRGQFSLIDHGTANGTHINGRRLSPESPEVIHNGDEIVIGDAARHGAVLRFQARQIAVSALPVPIVVEETPTEGGKTGYMPTPGRFVSSDIYQAAPQKQDDLILPEKGVNDTGARLAVGRQLLRATASNAGGPANRGRELPGEKFMLDPDDDSLWDAKRQADDDSWLNAL